MDTDHPPVSLFLIVSQLVEPEFSDIFLKDPFILIIISKGES